MRLLRKKLPCGATIYQQAAENADLPGYVTFIVEGLETQGRFAKTAMLDEEFGSDWKNKLLITVKRSNLRTLRGFIDKLIQQKEER